MARDHGWYPGRSGSGRSGTLRSMRRSLGDEPVGRYHEVDKGYPHGDEPGQGRDEARKKRGAVDAPNPEQHQDKGSVGEGKGVDYREPEQDHGTVGIGEHPVDLPEAALRADEGAHREQVSPGRRAYQKRREPDKSQVQRQNTRKA